MNSSRIVGPLVLIGLGLLFLINNLVVDISFTRILRDYWPLILVIIGVAQLAGAAAAPLGQKWGRVNGGVILITLGGLFLLARHTRLDFGDTWPVLLVVIGGLGLLRVLGPNRSFPGGFAL